jgi:ABC-type branched-subunit amino acid transport system ATPase component/sugar phosphate permease
VKARQRERLHAVTGDAPLFPLGVLFALFFFDEFDTAAFNTLAPEIADFFGLSDSEFGLLVVGNLSVVLLCSVVVGYYGDRLPRVAMSVASGLLAGVFSLLTGVVGTVALLALVRFANGVGNLANTTVHRSLLADYYPPERRPGVFAVHQNAVFLGAIIGPLAAGAAAALGGFKAAFFVLAVPLIIVSLLAVRLPNPRRGATDDPDAAAEAEAEAPPKFQEAATTLLAIPTLKRQYISYLFIGAGAIPLAFLLPLYLERVYGASAFERGVIGGVNAALQFAGVIVGGILARRWLAKDPGEPLKWAGISLITVGVGLTLQALAPSYAAVIVIGLFVSFAAGLFYPGFLAVQALVSPARVRTLSFGFGSVFLVGGVVLLWAVVPAIFLPDVELGGEEGNPDSYRLALGALLPYWVIGGLILASASRFVAADAAKAVRNLATTVEVRRRRLSTDGRSLLTCAGVDVGYDTVQVLFDIDLEIPEGQIVALLGTNGAGKSTLLRAISGLQHPTSGVILFAGEDITYASPQQVAERGVVQVPGGKGVFPGLTVAENLRVAGWLYKKDKVYLEQAIEEVLGFFPVLRTRWDQPAANLSGGEQQMLTLSQAFIAKPRLMMIDELSLGLAPVIVEQLLVIVRALRDRGTTIILVEQSVNVALTVADEAYFMEKGQIRFHGPTAELLHRPDVLRSVFLEGAGKEALQDIPPQAQNATGKRSPAVVKPRRAPATMDPDAAPILQVDGVGRSFGGIAALSDVSFAVRPGEVVGFIGPNGAGKTTLFDVVSGFVAPDGGQIHLEGVDVTRLAPQGRARAGLGRSFQDARLFPPLTVGETLAVACERKVAVKDPIAAALNLPAVADSEAAVALAVDELIELMNLGAFRDKFVAELSTGSRRVVDLGCILAYEPRVLLLDEPSSGIAQRETEALGPLLLGIRDNLGTALLVIEHDMPLITSISDRLVALELGRVLTEGSPTDVIQHPDVVASYLGTSPDVIARSGATTTEPSCDANGQAAPAKRRMTTKTTSRRLDERTRSTR